MKSHRDVLRNVRVGIRSRRTARQHPMASARNGPCHAASHCYLRPMTEILNIIGALLTVGFGLFGFLAPRCTAAALDLEPTGTTMGLSEMRASVGGLFVVAGLAAIWLGEPLAYAMIGFAYAGAAMGRVLSLLFDAPPLRKVLVFGGIEAALAAWFLLANLG